MKVKIKIPAKINLTLDVLGVKDGYHKISSLVASVNLYDAISLSARKDDVVNITFRGLPVGVSGEKSLAFRAARLFMDEFSVKGADIEITRSIPAGGGLGGSSADVAGVLLGMKKLYGVSRDMDNLASRLGSDTAYMLKGGYAVLKGRGEKIRSLPEIKKKFYLLIIACDKGVSSGECYAEFDRQGKKYPQRTGGAARLLAEGDTENFLKTLKNDLYLPACEFVPEIRDNVNALILYGAACMTGSGSAVYGIYPDKKTQNQVYKKLYPVYGKRLIKAKTII